jgi:hypothetical protein
MASVRSSTADFCHARWLEILGREGLNRRFFRELERIVAMLAVNMHPAPAADDASEVSLLYVSRLLFLSFLETKGWLNDDHAFLSNQFADCMLHGGGYHARVLKPLFFGTLNTRPAKRSKRAAEFGRIPFLNGGLFSRSPQEARVKGVFSDESIGDLFGDLLTRFRFTAREDAAAWTEAAIDPEMLGKAFESLMSSRDRKTSGAFYTPQSLVREVTSAGLLHVTREFGASDQLREIRGIRIIDPACGSGAFLVHVLEEVAALRRSLGDDRPMHVIRREVLTTSIYGVDINPTAVWLCELRLWLSVAIEDPERNPLRVATLPNLDRNIRVGDSLAGGSFTAIPAQGRRISAMRGRYTRASGPKKRALGRALDLLERKFAIERAGNEIRAAASERREILIAARSRDLFGDRSATPGEIRVRLRELRDSIRRCRMSIRAIRSGAALPFSFSAHFADVGSRDGFDLVLGNPPWIRSHNVDRNSRQQMRDRFSVARNATWQAGARLAGAGNGFGAQVDAAALFIEQGMRLLRGNGVASLIVPSKLWKSLAGGGVRNLLTDRHRVLELHDLTHAAHEFDAAVYPSIVVARSGQLDASKSHVDMRVHRGGNVGAFSLEAREIPFDQTTGSPWTLVPKSVRKAFDAVRRAGVPLGESAFERPLLGVKTGCNAAFILDRAAASAASIEAELLRPVVRGDLIRQWRINPSDEVILYPHDENGPIRSLPRGAADWLARWRWDLQHRTDLRPSDEWWRVFRTECVDATRPRVVWADIGRRPRVAVMQRGDRTIPLNTCYVVRAPTGPDARALAALLTSPLVNAWLGIIAEPVRGGYRRYFGWTMALCPVPHDWARAKEILGPLMDSTPGDNEHLAAALDAYSLQHSDVVALLEWEN